MKALLWLAKTAIGFVWLVLLVNIITPFPGNAAIDTLHHDCILALHAWLANADFRGRLWR
nr:DUF1145 domain-containing protein [Vibrio metoecus]